MCEVMCTVMFIIFLLTGGRTEFAVLFFVSAGLWIASTLYRIGIALEEEFGKKDNDELHTIE